MDWTENGFLFPAPQRFINHKLLIGALLLSCVLAEGIPQTFMQTSLRQVPAIMAWDTHLGISEGEIPMWKWLVLGLIGSVSFSAAAVAQSCSTYPYTLTNGTTADASQVMADFNCAALTGGSTLTGATLAGNTTLPGSGAINSSGQVGVGTSPSYPLDVNGTVRVTSNGGAMLLNTTASSAISAQTSYQVNGTNEMWIGMDWSGGQIIASGPAHALALRNDNGPIVFSAYSGGAEIARFDTGDSFLIGATSQWSGTPAHLYAQSPSNFTTSFYNSGAGAAVSLYRVDNIVTAYDEFYYGNGTEVGSITTNGSTITLNGTSDERLKSDRGVQSAAPELIALRVHSFVWKATNKPDVGLFAQEAYKVLPNIVTKGGTDPHKQPWQVNYLGLIPRLLVGWQNHEKRIEQLEKPGNHQAVQASSAENEVHLVELIHQLEARDSAEAAKVKQLEIRMDAMQRKFNIRMARN